MPVRSFIALPVPEAVSAALGDDAARLASQDKDGKVRWVGEENYHVTLVFLGDVEEPLLDDLAIDLDGVLTKCEEINLRVQSVALFPFGRRPRLIAAMIEPVPQLLELQQQVVRAVRRLSIPLEKRRFYPHVTLGRLRGGGGRGLTLPLTSVDLQGIVERLTIFESTLTPHGPIYEPLYEFQLAAQLDAAYVAAELE